MYIIYIILVLVKEISVSMFYEAPLEQVIEDKHNQLITNT